MTKTFEDMLYLFGAGCCGGEISARNMDIDAVRNCAITQGVWPMVYKAVEKSVDVKRFKFEYISLIAKSISKKEFTLSMLKKLERANIKYCLVKGAAVAHLYAIPECRISGDTDIYIDPRQESAVKKILEENGYKVENRASNDHHLKAVHPVGGLLEVHVSMYSKTTKDVVFDGKIKYSDNYEKIYIGGDAYYTMNAYDTLVYLTAHYIKHLVNGGCGVRQIMDILLFMDKNKDRIDLEKFDNLMEKLNYKKLIDVVKSIGAKYFGFDYPICHEDLMEKLLTDMENGGTFGYLADGHQIFYSLYCERRNKSSKAGHRIYMALFSERSVFSKIFPSAEYMERAGYDFAGKGFLLVFAWVLRWVHIAFRVKKGKNDTQSRSKALSRLEMMKELGMIE